MRTLIRDDTQHGVEYVAKSEADEEIEELREKSAKASSGDLRITDIGLQGGFHASFEGGAARMLAESFAMQFRESGAVNYIEMTLTAEDGLQLLVTLQKRDGKTPHQLRAEAEAKMIDAVAAEREACAKTCEEVATWAGTTWNKAATDCATWIRKHAA